MIITMILLYFTIFYNDFTMIYYEFTIFYYEFSVAWQWRQSISQPRLQKIKKELLQSSQFDYNHD